MSVETWRRSVSTTAGCIELFNAPRFKSDLVACLDALHESSLRALQSNDAGNGQEPQRLILLYRTIRNLCSVEAQARWIIVDSGIILKINSFLSNVFERLSFILSTFEDSSDALVLCCDVIRAAM